MCVGTDPNCLKPREAHTKVLVLQIGYYDNYPAAKVFANLVALTCVYSKQVVLGFTETTDWS
jgi:hypothetical protein